MTQPSHSMKYIAYSDIYICSELRIKLAVKIWTFIENSKFAVAQVSDTYWFIGNNPSRNDSAAKFVNYLMKPLYNILRAVAARL